MLVSFNWLQKHFKEQLPAPDKVAEALIFHSFEVEDGEPRDDDYVMEVKVLPDRAHDCLCHLGIAREIGAILKRPVVDQVFLVKEPVEGKVSRPLKIRIEDEQAGRRYIGRIIENVSVGPSPREVSRLLEAIGQRSINAVVDAANFVMFDLGQPLHVFDADRVSGDIVVRLAQVGEKLTTLDNREVVLDPETLVIADELGPLAIAGIKGGRRAEVTESTKNLILESANFDPVAVRKTSVRLGLRTDASKRYENEIDPERAERAMDALTGLILDWTATKETVVGPKIDAWPNPRLTRSIDFDTDLIGRRLGFDVPLNLAQDILERLGIGVEVNGDIWTLNLPSERIDLERPENIIEEIGRLYGYDKVKPKPLETKIDRTDSSAEKRYRVAMAVRATLVDLGFVEHYGYALTDHGEVALANPLASDKGFLRRNLSDELEQKLVTNLDQILFDTDGVQLFSIDQAFVRDGEFTRLAIGSAYKTKKLNQSKKDTDDALAMLAKKLGVEEMLGFLVDKRDSDTHTIYEFDFDALAGAASVERSADLSPFIKDVRYRRPSSYPRIVRDVAVWVPTGISADEVSELITREAGELLAEGPVLFDTFSKDSRTSLAFRFVLQSYEKTLSDEEANDVTKKVISTLEGRGWEVRK